MRYIGTARKDNLTGSTGKDYLKGGASSDTLTGGSGADQFWFSVPLQRGIDYITDFSSQQGDKLVLQLSPTSNKQSELSYNKSTGAVSLSGQTFAVLANKPDHLLATDFGISSPSGSRGSVVISSSAYDDLYLSYDSYLFGRYINSLIVGTTLVNSTRPYGSTLP